MPINSRAKGKRGELAAAKFFKEHGYEYLYKAKETIKKCVR